MGRIVSDIDLLSRRIEPPAYPGFGANPRCERKLTAAYDQTITKLSETWKQKIPADRAAVSPFLGYYEGGHRLLLDKGTPQIRIGSQIIPLLAPPRWVIRGNLWSRSEPFRTSDP